MADFPMLTLFRYRVEMDPIGQRALPATMEVLITPSCFYRDLFSFQFEILDVAEVAQTVQYSLIKDEINEIFKWQIHFTITLQTGYFKSKVYSKTMDVRDYLYDDITDAGVLTLQLDANDGDGSYITLHFHLFSVGKLEPRPSLRYLDRNFVDFGIGEDEAREFVKLYPLGKHLNTAQEKYDALRPYISHIYPILRSAEQKPSPQSVFPWISKSFSKAKHNQSNQLPNTLENALFKEELQSIHLGYDHYPFIDYACILSDDIMVDIIKSTDIITRGTLYTTCKQWHFLITSLNFYNIQVTKIFDQARLKHTSKESGSEICKFLQSIVDIRDFLASMKTSLCYIGDNYTSPMFIQFSVLMQYVEKLLRIHECWPFFKEVVRLLYKHYKHNLGPINQDLQEAMSIIMKHHNILTTDYFVVLLDNGWLDAEILRVLKIYLSKKNLGLSEEQFRKIIKMATYALIIGRITKHDRSSIYSQVYKLLKRHKSYIDPVDWHYIVYESM